jgi:hypothetical protein
MKYTNSLFLTFTILLLSAPSAQAVPITTSDSKVVWDNKISVSGGADYIQGSKTNTVNIPDTLVEDCKIVETPHGHQRQCTHRRVPAQAINYSAPHSAFTGWGSANWRVTPDVVVSGGYGSGDRASAFGSVSYRAGSATVSAGYDRTPTGSVAVSLGGSRVNPFVAYQQESMHYGVQYQGTDNIAAQAYYRERNQAVGVGLRFDVGVVGDDDRAEAQQAAPLPAEPPIDVQPLPEPPARNRIKPRGRG